ncbi:MAG: hypothetical protein V3W41_06115 [Planctomycetota bacterium]
MKLDTRVKKTLTLLLAAALGAAVASTSWILWQRLRYEGQLSSFETELAESPDHAKQLEKLRALDPRTHNASPAQVQRWRTLVDRAARPRLYTDLIIEGHCGEHEFSMPLGSALSPGVFIFDRQFQMSVRLVDGSPLKHFLDHIHLDNHQLDGLKDLATPKFEVGKADIAKIFPLVIEAKHGGFLGGDLGLQLVVTVDQELPRLELYAEAGRLQGDAAQLDLAGVKSLGVQFSDERLLAGASYRWDGGKWQTLAVRGLMEFSKSLSIGLKIDDTAKLELKVEDLAGNCQHRVYELRRVPKAELELSRLKIAKNAEALGSSLVTFAKSAMVVEIEAELSGWDEAIQVFVVLKGDERIALHVDEARRVWRGQIPKGERPREFACQLIIDNEEVEYSLKSILLQEDREAPRILITRNSVDLLDIPVIVCEVGDEFELTIRDQSPIDRDTLDVHWNGDLEALNEGAFSSAGNYQRRFRINSESPAVLIVQARDHHDQESSRRLEFKVPKVVPPDDSEGPALTISVDGIDLATRGENVLWKSNGELTLRVSDPSGMQLSKIKLTGATTSEALPTGYLRKGVVTLSHRSGPVVIEIPDRYGNIGRKTFQITRIDSAADLSGPAILDQGQTLSLATIPARFHVGMKQAPPNNCLRAYMRRSDARREDVKVELQELNAIVDNLDVVAEGTWRLYVVLQAIDGDHVLADVEVRVDE